MRTFDTNSTNEADGVSPTSYSSRTIHHYLSKNRGGNNAIIYEDVPGFRSASGAFPGARMWYDHWTYASRKGRGDDDDQQLNSDRRVHMHDDYVASTAKLASGAALEHIDAMRRRYEEVGALLDFHARGLGWVLDVSLSIEIICRIKSYWLPIYLSLLESIVCLVVVKYTFFPVAMPSMMACSLSSTLHFDQILLERGGQHSNIDWPLT